MMRRAALVLAILAALVGAPSSLLAAPPNQLSSPAASPTSGGVLTTFVLSVRYTSTGGNPARAVVAETGPLSVELSLVSGTAADGLWRGSTLLPAGTWTITFRAVVDQGPQPSLAGPTLNVAPAPAPTPPPSGPQVRPVTIEAQSTSTPETNPQATPQSASLTPDARPGGSAEVSAAPEQPSTNGEAPTLPPAGGVDARPAPATSSVRGGAETDTEPSPATGGNPTDGAPRASAGGSPRAGDVPGGGLVEADRGDPAAADLLLLLGVVVSVAAVTLLGTGWMLTGRGRDEPERASALSGRGRRSAAAARRAAGIEERRQRRRALRLPGHDPVLAALGLDIDDEADAGPAPRRGAARGAPPTSRPGPRR
jgi:hypothetical protein